MHDEAVEAEQSTTAFFTVAELVEVEEKPLAVKLQEMTDALAALTGGGKVKKTLSFNPELEVQTFEGKLLCRAT